MKDADFAFIASLLKDRSGLALTQDKIYLLDARLAPIARRNGLADVAALFNAVRLPGREALIGQVVDAMTTNETSFFRDRHPFDAFRKTVLPGLIKRREAQRSLRIWSAACSTGQEAYSLAMILRDEFPSLNDWRIEITGTDLSPTVVERAKAGLYNTFEVQRGLPIQLLLKHFERDGDGWRIKEDFRRRASFKVANLLHDLTALGTFDVIFCRNVLIYFDRDTKSRVLDTIAGRLAPDGTLILGGSESVFGISARFADLPGLRGVYGHNRADHKVPPHPLQPPITKVA